MTVFNGLIDLFEEQLPLFVLGITKYIIINISNTICILFLVLKKKHLSIIFLEASILNVTSSKTIQDKYLLCRYLFNYLNKILF